MQIDTRDLVFVCIGNTDGAVAEFPCVGGLILLGGDHLRHGVLLILDQGGLVDHHEVDILAVARLGIAAGSLVGGRSALTLAGGDDLAGLLRDLGIKTALRHLGDLCEALKRLFALGGVEILNKSQQSGRDVKISLLLRHLVLVHLIDGGSDSLDYACAGGESRAGNGGYTGRLSVCSEAEGVKLRHDLGADKFTRQPAERKTRSLGIVEGIDREHPAAVKIAPYGFVRQGNVAVDITAVTAVIGEALHRELGDNKLVCVCALPREIRRAVKVGGQRRQLIDLVKHGYILLKKCDCVCHVFIRPFKSNYLLTGRPNAARIAAFASAPVEPPFELPIMGLLIGSSEPKRKPFASLQAVIAALRSAC